MIEAATTEGPTTLTPTAQAVIEDGTALVGDAAAADAAEEARGVSRLKGTLTRGKFFPTPTRAVGAVGLASLFAYEVCKADAIQCWLFEQDQQLAPAPTTWKRSPWLVEFTHENGQDGIRKWNAGSGAYYEAFHPVGADGRGGGSAYWSGDPDCHPNCYPKQLQGLGPLQYAVTNWGGPWDSWLWWFPFHGPASVPTFSTVEMDGYAANGPNYDPLRLTYRPLISTQKITPKIGDDPSVPNAQPGATVPDAPDWAERTAQELLDSTNRDALELLARRVRALLADLPTCLGITFEACEGALRDAGLTGTITRQTLNEDDAIMEQAADRTTAIYPGGTVLRTTGVTVYVNPETMPTMTPTETAIAEALKSNNPDTITDQNKKTIARQCERYVTVLGSGRTVSDCTSPTVPIYVIGREWPEAANHTIRGLDYYPPWVLLTYKNVVRTSWYYSYPETDGGAASCRGTGTTSMSTACDEWPWQKTEQGGPSGSPLPHLKIINFGQNSASGNRYGRFVTDCQLSVRKALPTPSNGGGNFLVIPLSKAMPTPAPSLSLCNGTNP